MTHLEKLQKMYAHLPALGISPYTAAPPLYRLLWHFGVNIPPPIFGKLLPTTAFMGSLYAVGWGALMWLVFWSNDSSVSPLMVVAASVSGGLLFGTMMAGYYKYKAKQFNLPPWSEYTGQ